MVISAKESTNQEAKVVKVRTDDDDDDLMISIDGTGIKVNQRGQWMNREKMECTK